jgi:hypothetical protein
MLAGCFVKLVGLLLTKKLLFHFIRLPYINMSEENKKTSVEAEVVETKSSEHHKKHSDHHEAEHSKSHTHETKKEENKDGSETFATYLEKLTKVLDNFFNKQIPSLPANVKEVLVQIIPYLAIAGLVFYAFGLLLLLLTLPIILLTGSFGLLISLPFGLATTVLSAMSIPYLLKRQTKGWTYNYYAYLIGLVGNLFSGGVLALVIGGFIGGYFLFQLRSYYK